jgi:arylformamidase
MLMDEPLVAIGLAISGLFDLEPIRLCYLNEKLGLDTDEGEAQQPVAESAGARRQAHQSVWLG